MDEYKTQLVGGKSWKVVGTCNICAKHSRIVGTATTPLNVYQICQECMDSKPQAKPKWWAWAFMRELLADVDWSILAAYTLMLITSVLVLFAIINLFVAL